MPHIENPHWQLFTEYAALAIPFSCTAVFTRSWFFFPLEIVVLFFIPFLHFSRRPKAVLKNISRGDSRRPFRMDCRCQEEFHPDNGVIYFSSCILLVQNIAPILALVSDNGAPFFLQRV